MSQHEHEGGCCATDPAADPAEFERNYADNLRSRAQTYLNKEHASVAREMLTAARSLLKLHDGLKGEKLIWLLVAEAHLPILDGKQDEALKIFQTALTIAEQEQGEDQLTTAVCAINCADILLELGRQKEAKPLYERAHKAFKKVAAALKDKDEYLSKFAADGSALALRGSEVSTDHPSPKADAPDAAEAPKDADKK